MDSAQESDLAPIFEDLSQREKLSEINLPLEFLESAYLGIVHEIISLLGQKHVTQLSVILSSEKQNDEVGLGRLWTHHVRITDTRGQNP